MPTPLPTQLSGAKFLADRKAALLADAPRVGKTGAAIMAADYIFARKILIITTASGRAVWKRGLPEWSIFPRRVQVITETTTINPSTDCVIVGWPSIAEPKVRARLLRVEWDLIISDEDHYAKNFEAKRTQALYGLLDGDGARLLTSGALFAKAKRCWTLTGTPLPNSPFDMYPRLRALAPERLAGDAKREWPDVTREGDFKKRYCITRPKRISNFRSIDVIVGGRNERELAERLEGFVLLRTQEDVGIRPPVYETFPLGVTDQVRTRIERDVDTAKVLAAAEAGDTKALEMHLGPLRRLTGRIKAQLVVEALHDEFGCGLDKIVLGYWHKEVGEILRSGLSRYGVVGIDGSTPASTRQVAEDHFRNDPDMRVAVNQIAAAGEAVDFSAAATLWFVESSFIPKDMKQFALRITNHTQTRQCFVRVPVLEGSVDEALQQILLRKWTSIREVLA
ncbi:MAG: SNF2-related protein [Parvibaculaceae bacterium]